MNRFNKGDFVEFMTRQPNLHLQEMFGIDQIDGDDEIEEQAFVGRIESVIGNGSSFLLTTFSPLEGLCCVEDADKILRRLDDSEITGEMRNCQFPPEFVVPNVYMNTESLDSTVAQKCGQAARYAMSALFPEKKIESVEYQKSSDFIKKDMIAGLDSILKHGYDSRCTRSLDELQVMKKEIGEIIDKQRFKEYYTVNVGVKESAADAPIFKAVAEDHGFVYNPDDIDIAYYEIAVDLNFEEVSIMRDIQERTAFRRSLGPEADYAYHMVSRFRSAVFEKK